MHDLFLFLWFLSYTQAGGLHNRVASVFEDYFLRSKKAGDCQALVCNTNVDAQMRQPPQTPFKELLLVSPGNTRPVMTLQEAKLDRSIKCWPLKCSTSYQATVFSYAYYIRKQLSWDDFVTELQRNNYRLTSLLHNLSQKESAIWTWYVWTQKRKVETNLVPVWNESQSLQI